MRISASGCLVARVCSLVIFCVLVLAGGRAYGQALPEDELQVNLSGYFDSFNVNVVYPNVAVSHKVSESTSLNARYLADMISAASIRKSSDTVASDALAQGGRVDVVTSASGRAQRRVVTPSGQIIMLDQEPPVFDDVRHEIGLGLTQLIPGGQLALNGIYSTENDYTSATLAGTLTEWFARNNTSVQLGVVRSWDRVFPLTVDWKRRKDIVSFSGSLSQVLSQRAIFQVMGSYIRNTGYLADAYEQVAIAVGDSTRMFDPIQPDSRLRKAAAARLKLRLTDKESLELGYRYYWDSWDVTSHTLSGTLQRYLSPRVILGVGLRSYFQSRAYFFKPEYTSPQPLMTADIKLDSGFSNELQLDLTINGGEGEGSFAFMDKGRLQYNLGLNIYHRHTSTPYWFSKSKDLVSANVNAGIRYRF